MPDFKTELIALLETTIPELRDKIQAGAVDERTATPFVAFTTPEGAPIRTIHGIAGYITTFEIAVYDKKIASVETLKHRIIATLDGAELSYRRCYLKSTSSDYYADYDLHGITLTFKIV